jgi:parallel beta-helix repeat protein
MNLSLRYIFVFLFTILLGITTLTVRAQTRSVWYVDDLGDKKVGTGVVENPFRDLQKAIDTAKNGDWILILPGEYKAKPAPYIEGLCGNCQEHKTQVNATRGFLIENKSVHLVGSNPEETILITNAGYGILFERSLGSSITGVTITGGKRDPDGNATDAAVVAKFSQVTVKENHIVDNSHRIDTVVVGIGGVFGRENSELFILNNRIQGNGWDGIALYRGSSAFIADNVISDGRGAGVGITWDASATVLRNRISGFWKGIGTFGNSKGVVRNNAVFDNLGWGIIATGTSFLEASNNVIVRNGNCGFAIWSQEAKGECTNNIIVKNGWREEWVCPQVGMWNYGNYENFSITHNNIWGNEKGNYKDLPDLSEQDGNISVDPQFISETDFHLHPDSPLRDKGNPLFTDPDGTTSDIGMYGGPQSPTSK